MQSNLNKIKSKGKLENRIIKIGNFVELHYKVFFALILTLAIFLNIYKLGIIPNGIDCDEAGATYDAYCIANYGVDRFLKKNPVYFINYGDGQNALYTYLLALFIKIIGKYNLLIVRVPSMIFSLIEVIMCYLIVKEFRSKKEALLFMFLVTISPWHVMKSRWGLESYLLSSFQTISIYTLIKAIKSEKRKLMKYIFSGFMFGITLYTYAISYISIPLFLLFMLVYLIKNKKIRVKEIIAFVIPLFILATPLVLEQAVNKGYINEIDSFITMPKLLRYRASDLKISDIKENIKNIKHGLICDDLNFNSIRKFGIFYYIGSLMMLFGFIIIIYNGFKKKKLKMKEENGNLSLDIIMLFSFISNIIIAFFIESNANRLNGTFLSATYFELVALRKIYKEEKEIFTLFFIIYFVTFLFFLKAYFIEMSNDFIPYWDNGATDAFLYLDKNEESLNINKNNKMIYGDDFILYTYKLYSNPISPYEFYNNCYISNNTIYGYENYRNISIDVNNIDTDAIYLTFDSNKAQEIIEKYNFKCKKFKHCYLLGNVDF